MTAIKALCLQDERTWNDKKYGGEGTDWVSPEQAQVAKQLVATVRMYEPLLGID
ncbi:MAG: hypothetical protein KGJ62_15480 [Armatimonadetes bacterium]|nr:hypothetical protein [Armatimonadota bacterium]